MYGLMYHNKTNLPIQAGIYSFKNRKSGYLMFCLKNSGSTEEYISNEILVDFKKELIHLLNHILNPTIAFEENVI